MHVLRSLEYCHRLLLSSSPSASFLHIYRKRERQALRKVDFFILAEREREKETNTNFQSNTCSIRIVVVVIIVAVIVVVHVFSSVFLPLLSLSVDFSSGVSQRSSDNNTIVPSH